MRSTYGFMALTVLSAFAPACVAPAEEETTTQSSDSALVTLGSNEIIGTLCYGQTSAPVAYNDTPKYRAFRFEGVAGDAVSIWVRSKNGDARAWLVDAAFLNVAMNNDADATTKDSHVVTTLPATGTYYVAFREVSQEDATFVVSLDKTNTPTQPPACDPEEENCTPGGGTTGRVVDGDDRSLSGYFQANEVVESWGKGLWDGYVSMTAYNYGNGRSYIVDGSGQNYELGKSIRTKFDRLPLPIQLVSSNSTSIGVQLTGMKYEVTGTHAIAPSSLRGKFEGTSAGNVKTLGSDIPGVKLNFVASATFFRNFSNGNGCANLTIKDARGQKQYLSAAEPSKTISLIAPVSIDAIATCISSRIANPQDAAADYQVGIANISVGDSQ